MIDSISPDRRERWFNHVANLLCLRQILDRHWVGLGDKRLQEECSFHQIEPVSEGRNINVGANDTHGYSNHEIEKQLQLRATKLLLLGSSAQPCFNQILQQILDDLNTPDASNSDRNDERYYSDVTDQRDLDHKVGARHNSSTEGWEQWEDSLSNKDVPESDPGSEASTTNAMLFNMPLKSRRSLLNKLARKHRLHPSGVETEIGAVTSPCPATDRIEVNDVVRSSIVCTSVTQILRLLRILRSPEAGSPVCVLNVKNRFKNPLPSGYRDFLVSFRVQVPDSNSNSVTALTTSSTTDSSHSGQNVEKFKGDGSNTDMNYSDDIPTYEDSGEIVEAGAVRDPKVEKVGPSSGRAASCGVNMRSDVSRIVERKFISPVYFTCELQIHLLPFLAFSHRVEILRSPKVPQYISSYSMYVHFRQYFLSTKYDVKRAKTRFKVVEKMNQSLDHPRLLENAIEKFFEGLGRVTKELDRLAAHFEFFQFVGESSLAEKFQMAVISLLQENSLRRHHATLTRPPTSSAKEGEGALLRNDEGQNGGIDTFVTVYALGHTESSDFELSTSGCPILFGDGSSSDVGVEVDKCLPESNETTVEKEKEKERDKEEENKEKTTRVNVPAHGAASSMGDDGGTILTASLEDGRCPSGDNEEEEESDEMHLITNEMGKLHWIAGCIPFFLMHDLDLVMAIRELGRHLCALDRHKEALSIYTDLYDMHGRHFGWMHWDSLVFRFKRAQLLCVLGDNQLALDDCNELIAVCESKIDSEEDTEGGYRRLCLQVLNCIAETHLDSGLMEKAEETYSILLKKLIAERGECSVEVAAVLLGTVELNEILGNLPIVTSTLKSIVQIYAMTIQSTADSLKGEAEEAFQRDLSDEISMTKSLVMLADVTDRMERKAESLIIHENVLDLRRKVLREERARERETCGNDVEVGVSRDLALAMSDVAESLGRVGSLLLSIAPLRLHQAIKYLEEALTIREQLCLSASRREDEQYESDAWLLLATSQCDLAEGLLAVASAKISVLKQFFDGVAIGDTNVRTYIGTADARTCAIAESSPTTTRRRHDYSEEEEIAPSLRLELLDRSQNLFEKSLTSRMRIQGAEHLATRRAANKQDVVLEMIKVEQLRDRIVFFSDTSERFPLLQLAVEKEADGRRKEEIFCKMELQGGIQRTAAYNIDETMTRNRMHSFSYSFSEDKYVPQQHDIILKLDPSSSCEKYSLSLGPSSLPHINVKKTRQCDDPSKAETSLYLSTGTISYDCSEKSHSSTSTPKNPISLKRFPSSSCSSSSPASRATSEREGKRKLSRAQSAASAISSLYSSVPLDQVSEEDLLKALDRKGPQEMSACKQFDSIYEQGSFILALAMKNRNQGLYSMAFQVIAEAQRHLRVELAVDINQKPAAAVAVVVEANTIGYSSLSISQAILQSHIGSIYEAAQDYQTAQLFFIQTLTTVRDVYGVNVHPRVLCAILNLGGVLLAQRAYSAALELFLEAEEMMGKLAGQDEWGIDGGTLRRCIAICYCGLMRFENATAYITRAVKDLKELTGGTSIEYTGALNTLALISLAKNDYKGAVDIFQKIVDIRLDVYGFAHEAFALASNNLGVALMVAGELEKGGDMLRKTITNRELIFGKGSQMVGKGLSNLSVVYRHAFNAYTATQLNATRMQQDVKVVKVEGPSNYFPSIMSAFTRKKDKNKDSDKNHDKDKNEDKGKNNDKNKEKDRRGSMSSAQSRQSKVEEEGRNLGLRGITLSETAKKITKSHTDFLSSLLDTIPGEYEAHLMHLDDMQEQLLQSSAARKESLRNVAFLDS